MASETRTTTGTRHGTDYWRNAALSGIAGGIVMGLMIQFVMGIMPVIGALYGMPGLLTGWLVHLFHSVLFALVFAAVVRSLSDRSTGSIGRIVALGAGYGVGLWLVAAAIVMPIWMSVVGLPAPDVPNLNPMSLVGHVVYGVVVGATLAVLEGYPSAR